MREAVTSCEFFGCAPGRCLSAVQDRCFKEEAVLTGASGGDQTTCDYFGCEQDAKCGDPLDGRCASATKIGINEFSDLMESSPGRSYLRAAGWDV